MSSIQQEQCPNCWGYQEYDEAYPNRELCTCKKEK